MQCEAEICISEGDYYENIEIDGQIYNQNITFTALPGEKVRIVGGKRLIDAKKVEDKKSESKKLETTLSIPLNISCKPLGQNLLTLEQCYYKTEKMEDLKSKHIKILDSRISSEIDLENIKAVETARKYEFFDTELPENFAKKLDAKLGYGFCSKLSKICKKYGISEKDLIGLMFSESGLDPQARNSNGGATGLIQFMPETAEKQLHTTTSALYDMSAVQQLDYVDKYFSSWLKEGGNYDAGELYTAVYMPSRVGRDVVAVRGGSGYSGNAGLDSNGDGQTTKAELAQKVKNKYQDALNAYNC